MKPVREAVGWPIPAFDHVADLSAVLKSKRWTRGTQARMLEEQFINFTGACHAVSTGSGTSGLEAVLSALEVSPGDEVIVPAFTFTACAHAVINLGATPVFADVEPATFGLDIEQVERAWSDRTKAVMIVHLHGVPARFTEGICELARSRGASVVEDACQAIGTRYAFGEHVGLRGAAGVFSLNATKNTPAGEGGVVVTNEKWMSEIVRSYVTFGEHDLSQTGFAADAAGNRRQPAVRRQRSYVVTQRGGAVRMNELSATVGRVELLRLPDRIAAMEETEPLLRAAVEAAGLTPPFVPEKAKVSWHKYRVRTRHGALRGVPEIPGVPTAAWMERPLSRMPYFSAKGRTVSDDVAADVLAHTFLIGDEQYPLIAQPRAVVEAWCDRIVEASQGSVTW